LSRCEPAAEWLAYRHAEWFAKSHAEWFAKSRAERLTNYDAERLANHDTNDTYDVALGKPQPNADPGRSSPDAGAGQLASDGLSHWELTARGRCATGRSASAARRMLSATAC
jgi:hypothetical protein